MQTVFTEKVILKSATNGANNNEKSGRKANLSGA
jgi:hypothetical protein